MNKRERVWAALNKTGVDRPPAGEIIITDKYIKDSSKGCLELVLADLGADLLTLKLGSDWTSRDWRYWANRGYFVFGLLDGPFTLMANKLGWLDTAYLIVNKPEETKAIMKNYFDEGYKLTLQALDAGCEGIVLADDLAGQNGLIVAPQFLEKYYFPLLAQFLTAVGYREIPFIFHSDGNILDIVLLLKEAGLWGIQSLQPSAGMDIEKLPAGLLSDWVFWGNFEFEGKFAMKTMLEVKEGVNCLIKRWRSCPGYIFGSSGGLYQGIIHDIAKTAYTEVNAISRI